MKKWEYMVDYSGDLDTLLNFTLLQLNDEGWEIISVVPITGKNGETSQVMFFCKRPAAADTSSDSDDPKDAND